MNRTNLIQKALNHIAYVDKEEAESVKKSIENSVIYRHKVFDERLQSKNPNIKTIVEDSTTTDAIFNHFGKIGVLNFASYKWPGGGFINGAMAQEEALCHDSTLYNVISNDKFEPYYFWNRIPANSNKGLYTNFGIYSPNIVFMKNGERVECDVITVPAPNLSAYGKIDSTYMQTLKDRIYFVLDIAKKHNIETLILGAFGCGVFGNDPLTVANIFKEALESGWYHFKEVVFAIPGGYNLKSFIKVYGEG